MMRAAARRAAPIGSVTREARARTSPRGGDPGPRGPAGRRPQPAPGLTTATDGTARSPSPLPAAPARTPVLVRRARRHAGLYRRALRRELSRLRDPRRLLAIVILGVVLGAFSAGLLARGEAAGADAHAYWAGVRIWLAGGDPYAIVGPFMPYVYAPWMLPLFLPWALLPWDVAWFFWRGATILLLFWTVAWAYERRPLSTAAMVLLLSFPIAANVDTGNVNLLLAFMLWAAQIVRPPFAGLLWALATAMKWVPIVFLPLLARRARGWGLAWLGLFVVLTIATLPATVDQIRVIFAFPRPARVDYLVLLWAAVPWIWRHPQPLWWIWPSAWPGITARVREWVAAWRGRLSGGPRAAVTATWTAARVWTRRSLGLDAG